MGSARSIPRWRLSRIRAFSGAPRPKIQGISLIAHNRKGRHWICHIACRRYLSLDSLTWTRSQYGYLLHWRFCQSANELQRRRSISAHRLLLGTASDIVECTPAASAKKTATTREPRYSKQQESLGENKHKMVECFTGCACFPCFCIYPCCSLDTSCVAIPHCCPALPCLPMISCCWAAGDHANNNNNNKYIPLDDSTTFQLE